MTTTAEIVERLRQQHLHHCFQIDREAADHMESLARERDRAVEALEEVIRSYPDRDCATLARRTLADIDTESEGER